MDDANGNVVSRTDQYPAARTETFAYDSLNRLEAWTPSFGAAVAYDHDALGNLVQMGGVTQRYGEAGAGPHQLTSTSPGSSYTYDALGRRATGGSATVTTWTHSNLPRDATGPGGSMTLVYDALGGRTLAVGESVTRTYFDELYEREQTPDTVRHTFRLYAEGDSFAEVREDDSGARQTYYLHRNHQGSVAAVTDASGAVTQWAHHDPYGQRHAYEPPNGAPVGAWSARGFTGHEHDVELGLINMRGRMYDPDTGRFLSPDPIIRDDLVPDALNAYSYVENNPVTLTDPTGFCPTCIDDGGDGFDAGSAAAAGLFGLLLDFINRNGGGTSGSGSSSGSGGVGGGTSGSSGRRRRDVPYEAPRVTSQVHVSSDFVAPSAHSSSPLGGIAGGWTGAIHPFDGPRGARLAPQMSLRATDRDPRATGLDAQSFEVCPSCHTTTPYRVPDVARGNADVGDASAALLRLIPPVEVAVGAVSVANGDFDGFPALASGVLMVVGMRGPPTGFTSGVGVGGTTTTAYAEGSFSIADWTGYPAGMPRPTGPVRLLTGAEYASARALANEANAAVRAANPTLHGSGLHIHEIQPVVFNGSPTDFANKMLLPAAEHIGVDGVHPRFWAPLQRWVQGGG